MQKMDQRKTEGNPFSRLEGDPFSPWHISQMEGDQFFLSDDLITDMDDGSINVISLLKIVEHIFERATPSTDATITSDKVEGALVEVQWSLSRDYMLYSTNIIPKIERQILSSTSVKGLLSTLPPYPWIPMAVLALASFAVSYGDFWLTAQVYTTNPIAHSIAILTELPDTLSLTKYELKPGLDAINNLIKAMIDMIKCCIDFFVFIKSDDSHLEIISKKVLKRIPIAVYWIIRGVMTCFSVLNDLREINQVHMTELEFQFRDISTLADRIRYMHGFLEKILNQNCDDIVYEKLVRLFETSQADNIKVLKALIYSKDHNQPLVDGSTKKRVENLKVFKSKTVMLFISDLNIPEDELLILEQLYNDPYQPKDYEVIWFPVLDSSTESISTGVKKDTFNRLHSSMPWYTLHGPSLLHPVVIKYIKEKWQFDKKPLLVVLDPRGRVICQNALHMIWIWGTAAFPFTRKREQELWNEETWRIEFLVRGIDPSIPTWIEQGKFVCLYGGEDINWIRKFTSTMQRVGQEAGIPLEMVYVGKSNPKERVRKNVNTIITEKLSHCLQDLKLIWFFWVRLESMWYSKMQHDKTIENDHIMREIMLMLTFDGSENGWVVIGGREEMAKAPGKKILSTLANFDEWKVNVERETFIPALINALNSYQSHEHCACLVLPRTPGKKINEQLSCVECGRPMEKYILYRCCDDEASSP